MQHDTEPRETGISRGWNFSKATVQHEPGSLEQPHPSGYPKCIPVDSPVPVQQADAHLDGSPLQKKKMLAQWAPACYILQLFFFFKYFHWFLSRNPRAQSLCVTCLFCDVSAGTNVQTTLRSPWNKWPLNELTALNNKALKLTFPSFFFGYCNGPREHISCAK